MINAGPEWRVGVGSRVEVDGTVERQSHDHDGHEGEQKDWVLPKQIVQPLHHKATYYARLLFGVDSSVYGVFDADISFDMWTGLHELAHLRFPGYRFQSCHSQR